MTNTKAMVDSRSAPQQPLTPGYLGTNNALRGRAGPLILALFAAWVLGMFWEHWVGFPNPLFGAEDWTLAWNRHPVDPLLWRVSLAIEVCTIASMIANAVLWMAFCERVPLEPRSRGLVIAFWLIALVGLTVPPILGILGF